MTGLEVGAIMFGVILGLVLLVWGIHKIFWRDCI